jgi:hypothetical protein
MKKSLVAVAALLAVVLPYIAQAQVFKVEDRHRFHEAIINLHHPSYHHKEEVRVGLVLPEAVEFHVAPTEYHLRPEYRYAVVNDRIVIVEAGTRRVIEIIEP